MNLNATDLNQKAKLADDLTRVILPLGAALSAEKDLDRLLERILVEAKSICNADAGTLYLRTDENTLRFSIMRTDSLGIALGGTTGKEVSLPPLRLYDPGTNAPNEHNVATHVALRGSSVNIPDIYNAEGFDFSGAKAADAIHGYRTMSCLAVPLKDHDGNAVGVLQLINAQDPETGEVVSFDSYAQQVVESLASQASIALSNQLLLERQQRLLTYERDIQIGRVIQGDFLPQSLPQPPGWEIAAMFRPARQVAGDFYDVFHLMGERHVALVIADVSDKGVPAALFMALIRSLLRAFSEQSMGPGLALLAERLSIAASSCTDRRLVTLLAQMNAINTVALTNRYLVLNHSHVNMFATLFWCILDPLTGQLVYVNCGHNAPLILRRDGTKERLAPTGPAIGILPNAEFDIAEATLECGDYLFAFTDGVTDAKDLAGKFFSEERLESLLEVLAAEQTAMSAMGLLDGVAGAVQKHAGRSEQFDDITMLAVRRA